MVQNRKIKPNLNPEDKPIIGNVGINLLILGKNERLDGHGKNLAAHQGRADIDPVPVIQAEFIQSEQIVFQGGFAAHHIDHPASLIFFKDEDDR